MVVSHCRGQLFQRDALLPAAAIDLGALTEPGKERLGSGNVSIDLPQTGAAVVFRPVFDEAPHVLRGVAEE